MRHNTYGLVNFRRLIGLGSVIGRDRWGWIRVEPTTIATMQPVRGVTPLQVIPYNPCAGSSDGFEVQIFDTGRVHKPLRRNDLGRSGAPGKT